jgi:hypothetical protein
MSAYAVLELHDTNQKVAGWAIVERSGERRESPAASSGGRCPSRTFDTKEAALSALRELMQAAADKAP